jgi:hypothetical protein
VLGLLLPWSAPLHAQPLELPAGFREKLQLMQLDLFLPVDSDYRLLAGNKDKDDFQPCDLAMRSRKEKMEIRYLAYPWREEDLAVQFPHILAMRTVTHVATNEEDVPITLLSLGAEELQTFHADWGAEYIFTPKPEFSKTRYAKLLALFKEERGVLMIFFLFDDPDNPAVDLRYQSAAYK